MCIRIKRRSMEAFLRLIRIHNTHPSISLSSSQRMVFSSNSLSRAGRRFDFSVSSSTPNAPLQSAASINSELSEVIANCAGMTADEVIKQVSSITNFSRLANLSPETKYKIVSNFVNDITKTGVFTSDDVLKMLENIPVSTRLDGSTVPMSELVDVNAVREVATAWQSSHITQWSLSLMNEYKNDYYFYGLY